MPGQRQLESDPSIPIVDEDGEQLLRHARVYTLAEKFQVPALKNLSQSKIHCVNSTAKGEIAYARYVYGFTPKDDVTIREPVAHFWATRSHTLRAEAEEEFRSLCLEYPEFGYDVLSTWPAPVDMPVPSDQPQLVSWTRSSSASETTRCTLGRPVRASGLDTASAATPRRETTTSERSISGTGWQWLLSCIKNGVTSQRGSSSWDMRGLQLRIITAQAAEALLLLLHSAIRLAGRPGGALDSGGGILVYHQCTIGSYPTKAIVSSFPSRARRCPAVDSLF